MNQNELTIEIHATSNLIDVVHQVSDVTSAKRYRVEVHELLAKALDGELLRVIAVGVITSIVGGVVANAIWNFVVKLWKDMKQRNYRQALKEVSVFSFLTWKSCIIKG